MASENSRSSLGIASMTENEPADQKNSVIILASPDSPQQQQKNKPQGWKAMPFILGNETFERLGTIGLMSNFMVYLIRVFHMDQVSASNVLNIWSGVTHFGPLVGAFISDAYAGRFRTIAFASFAALLGMVIITLTAWLPQLHPQPCTPQQLQNNQCEKHTTYQLSILIIGLSFLSLGSGGIRPCSIPFGVDQFDQTTEEGMKGVSSYFNWYYTTFTIVIMISLTLVVYIQDSVSWVLGFGIPTMLMLCSIILFFAGMRRYVYVKPEGSTFSGVVQVFVAAYRKRHIALPAREEIQDAFYDPPAKGNVVSKLPLTKQLSFLNKAAAILDREVKPDGSRANVWRLCSIQQVEEAKCLIKIAPIWASGIISLVSMTQQGTFVVSQALKMDRGLGQKFQIPAGSMAVISMITIAIWLPIYDRIIVPRLRKVTKHETGISLLQRMGIGIVFSILSMVVAGLIERKRRISAILRPQPLGVAPITVFWLAPQLILMGFCEAFNIIGQIEFFNHQLPDNMRSIGNALFSCSFGGSSYISAMAVTIVHHVTRRQGRPDWLTNDINLGRLDYFYFLLASMGILNFVYFLWCARRYHYKKTVLPKPDPDRDIELNSNNFEVL